MQFWCRKSTEQNKKKKNEKEAIKQLARVVVVTIWKTTTSTALKLVQLSNETKRIHK